MLQGRCQDMDLLNSRQDLANMYGTKYAEKFLKSMLSDKYND